MLECVLVVNLEAAIWIPEVVDGNSFYIRKILQNAQLMKI